MDSHNAGEHRPPDAQDPCFGAAAEFKAPLFAGSGLALLAAVAALAGLNVLDTGTLAPLALYAFLLAVALFLVAWVVGLRREAWRERRVPPKAPAPTPSAARELARFGRLGGRVKVRTL